MIDEVENASGSSIAIMKYDNPQKIEGPTDAYLGLVENWDDHEMYSYKQYKALLLDSDDRLIAKLTLPRQVKFTTRHINSILNRIIDIAKSNGATQIIIGQNNPLRNILPTPSEMEMAAEIKKISELEHMPVYDQIILSGSSYYSFKKNGL
jgi:DNA repair protein RadC